MNKSKFTGSVIWLTGLSGSGKSTIAKAMQKNFMDKGLSSIILDGDDVRAAIQDPYWKFDKPSRIRGSYRYSKLAKLIAEQEQIVIVPTISMFEEVRVWNRCNIPGYFEVYLRTSQSTRESRDPKLLYKKNKSGQNELMAGVDLSIELPSNPNIIIDNNGSLESLPFVIKEIITSYYNYVGLENE